MRLLNANTLEFEEFHKNAKPPYIILSHTWGPEEVSYQDIGSAATEEEITRRSGYDKIVQMARIATSRNYTYFWIDTCCIDKSSSSELQESINSMYHWYQDSNMCFVYLEDGEPLSKDFAQHEKEFRNIISKSRWITRGWTLQELIAPRAIVFSDRYWKVYHLNKPLQNQIVSESAKVPSTALGSGNLGAYSVAQKFSWAASRSTTRIEDEAYCLLGLFDIHMPMLYGEGQKAFVRLQEQLVQTSNDDSLFAWRSSDSGPYIHRGLLARSPRESLPGTSWRRWKE
ncbi:HET-domain-containing protein [Polyplosphaeria fusca]|uniref:HET-domain-containing protein n=1 Tax=Polyplosphaeria fusca TaxID=682080 RepID=A0A9P4QQ45_9PLEO|nr:HET-domain-containing protein [Polyplosphaeria fusca]